MPSAVRVRGVAWRGIKRRFSQLVTSAQKIVGETEGGD